MYIHAAEKMGGNKNLEIFFAAFIKSTSYVIQFRPLTEVLLNLRSLRKFPRCPNRYVQVIAERDLLPEDTRPPLLVKISPDLSPAEREDVAACVCRPHPHRNPDGLIVSNTSTSRPSALRSHARSQRGGLSGEPIREMSTHSIREMYRLTGGI